MSTRGLGLWALVTASLVMTSGRAWADGPSEIDKDAARTSLEQGDERMRAKEYAAALEAYQRADDIMGVPTTSIEVGRAALALGRLVIAHDAFRRAAAYPKKAGEPPPFAQARKEADKLASELKARVPLLEVEVEVQGGADVDVEVAIDEVPIDAWGSSIRIDPGLHVVRAEALGYQPASREVVLQEGESRTLVLELLPLDAKDAPAEDTSGLWWTIAAVSLPIGGASLVAGAVTGGLSLSDASAVQDQCDGERCPPEVADQLDRSQTLAHVSTATLVVGGVGVALGVTAIAIALSSGDDEVITDARLAVGPAGAAFSFDF